MSAVSNNWSKTLLSHEPHHRNAHVEPPLRILARVPAPRRGFSLALAILWSYTCSHAATELAHDHDTKAGSDRRLEGSVKAHGQ